MKVLLQERIVAPEIMPQIAHAVLAVMVAPNHERAESLAGFFLSEIALTTWHKPVRHKDAADCQRIAEALATIQTLLPGLSFGAMQAIESRIWAPWAEDWSDGEKAFAAAKAREEGWLHFRNNLARWRTVFADQARRVDKAAKNGEVAHHRLNHEALIVCRVGLVLWQAATGERMEKVGPSATNPFIEFLASILEITGTNGEAEHVFDSYLRHPWPSSSDSD